MTDLRDSMESLEFEQVKTYIQSGNVVFQAKRQSESKLAGKIQKTIEQSHGIKTPVLVLGAKGLTSAIDENPFPDFDAKLVHFFFLARKPKGSASETLEDHCKSGETFLLSGKVLYLHTPDGFAKSKVATKVEKVLGVPATARNLRTVQKLGEMIEKSPSVPKA